MKSEKSILAREAQIKERIEVMREFLLGCYKGSDARVKVDNELTSLKRQLAEIEWVIDRELPF